MLKSKFAIAVLLLVFLSPFASASPGSHHNKAGKYYSAEHSHDGYPVFARVIYAQPVYKTIRVERPVVECFSHPPQQAGVTVIRQHSPENIIVGGILGGIVGHELGNNYNRDITTLAGVVIGSTIANNISTANYVVNQRQNHNISHCQQHTSFVEERVLVGYHVKYKYRGRIYTTRTATHPGDRIPVRPESENRRYRM